MQNVEVRAEGGVLNQLEPEKELVPTKSVIVINASCFYFINSTNENETAKLWKSGGKKIGNFLLNLIKFWAIHDFM